MQELIKELIEKVGITEDQALKSVDTIKTFIQSKLPPMMHGLVDNFLNPQAKAEDSSDFMG